jgi:transposase
VGYKGQQRVERGFRFLTDPRFLACSLYPKQPERIRALLMVMPVCSQGVTCLGASHPKGAQEP